MATISFQPTPNPDSLKFTSNGRTFIPSGMGAYASAAEAAADPLAAALFGVDGVANVLILPTFVTVTKRSDASWDQVLPRIESILTAHVAD